MAERLGRLALRKQGISNRRVVTPFGAVHTYDARGLGELPTTVLLHGLGSAATPFGRVLAHLRQNVRRIVAPDYPGHGFSAEHGHGPLTPDRLFESVSAALDHTIDEPAILVGNSLGGAVALRYAIDRPDRVRALVLVSPAGARSTEEEWRALRAAFDIKSRADAHAFLQRLYHEPPWFLPLVAHEIHATIHRRAVRDLLATASNDHAPPPDALTSLRMPVLLVWGKSERLLPHTHFEYFARHLPDHAVIERPDGFGHCPHFDAPAALAQRIVRFARAAQARAQSEVEYVPRRNAS